MRSVFQRGIVVCLVVLACSATAFAGQDRPNRPRRDRLRTATHEDHIGIPPASPTGGNASTTTWSVVVRFWQRVFSAN